MTPPRFKRILLNLSGEVLMGPAGLSIDPTVTARVAGEIADVRAKGYEICIVVGGGNIFRGLAAAAKGFERATADYMGMLATVMNALAVQNALEQIGIDTRVQSAIPMASVCEPFIRRRAERHLEKGRIVIFGAGTAAATAGVRGEDAGVAGALVNTVQQIGGSLGTALLTTALVGGRLRMR